MATPNRNLFARFLTLALSAGLVIATTASGDSFTPVSDPLAQAAANPVVPSSSSSAPAVTSDSAPARDPGTFVLNRIARPVEPAK